MFDCVKSWSLLGILLCFLCMIVVFGWCNLFVMYLFLGKDNYDV